MTWAARPMSADADRAADGVPQRLGAGVVGVAELRSVRRQRGTAAGHHDRVDRRQRHEPAAQHGVPVGLPRHGTRRASLGPSLDLAPGGGRLLHLLGPRHLGHRGVEGAAGERAPRAHHAAQGDRHVVGQLLDGEVRAEVVGDRVEAAGMDQPRAGVLRGGVVRDVHPVDELRLAGQVDVVGAGLGTRRDERLAVAEVGPDGGDHHAGAVGDVLEGDVVGHVGVEEWELVEARVDRGEVLAHALELRLVAPGQGPAEAVGRVMGEVLGSQTAGESGRAEERDVELSVGGRRVGHAAHRGSRGKPRARAVVR